MGGRCAVPCRQGAPRRTIMLVSISIFSSWRLLRLEDIPEVAVCNTCPSPDRQHHGDALTEQVRGNQVQESGPLGPRNHSVVSDLEHFSDGSPYFELLQCRGRASIDRLSPQSGASSPPGALHRMVSGPGDSQPTLRFMGRTYSRPVHHQAEYQGRGFLCTPPPPTLSPCQGTPCRWIDLRVFCTCTPQPLLSLALHRVIRQEAQVIAIIPWWPRRGWFPWSCSS